MNILPSSFIPHVRLGSPPARWRALAAATLFGLGALAASAATINVNSNSTLSSALAAANPGDTIVLANGTYAGFTMSRDGTSTNPITIAAAATGGATISSGIIHFASTSYVTVQGLNITSNGGTQTIDGVSKIVVVWFEVADHCQLTRCTVRPSAPAQLTQFVHLSGASNVNRVDHNEFGPNTVHGCHMVWPGGNATIPGVTPPSDRTSWAEGNGPVNPNISRNTRIDHNYFHDQAAGTAEVMVLGAIGMTGDYQNTNTLVEYNLFVNCDGDPEIVSVKSSSNTIRYNTVRTSAGMFSLRAGNDSFVYGNFSLQGAKLGSGGVKIYEKNHTVYNNYIENADQYPILIGAGDAYGGGNFAHAQVFNAWVVNNTVVAAANRPVIMGHGSTDNLPPTGVVFANNIIQGSAAQLYDERIAPVGNSVYAKNIVWSSSTGVPSTGFLIQDPKLTTVSGLQKLSSTSPAINAADASHSTGLVDDDMDGQPRDATPDIGADQVSTAPVLRQPLTTADVGPNSPPDVLPVSAPGFNPVGGTYTSVQSVTITTATSGASIRYTTDGSTPTSTVGTVYASPVSIASTTTLKAIAYKSGNTDSAVSSATYMISVPAVSAPSFNPVGGNYTSTQSVTIATPTSGASIRYTTDGSAPTSTVGAVYISPVSIASTTTLKAIAYKSGSTDSSVTSATYTISVSSTITMEAESLARTGSGATTTLQTDANTSGGQWVSLDSTANGQFIEFTLPGIPAGTYSLKMSYKTNNNRGILSLKVDGTQLGGTIDQYATPSTYPSTTLGNVTFATSGNHVVRLTVTGKNASSSSSTLSADKFTLTPTTTPPPTVTLEAESLTTTTSGPAVTTGTDAAASGGVITYFNATAAAQWVEYTTPSLVAGTYQVKLQYKQNNARGQHSLTVDGTQVGGTIDEYAAASSYTSVTVGTVSFAAAGTHTIRLTVTGKNAASSSFVLAPDSLTFVGQ